jgi:glycosyltransferase involved in cell wall biosynthesis
VQRQKRAIDRWKYRRALTRYYDAVVVNSRTVQENLLATFAGLQRGVVHLVPNGIDGAASPVVGLRRELGIDSEIVLLVAAGGLEKRKGFDLLIRALQRLEPRVHVAIAGDGPERDALRALAISLGVASRVHLLGKRGDMPALLADADVFVLSSRSEGMAVAMLEAMVARRPVVATDVGGVREALAPHDGRPAAGWIIPVDDVDALVLALNEVIASHHRDQAAIEARVAESAWRAQNWFSVERMVDGYERVLNGSNR